MTARATSDDIVSRLVESLPEDILVVDPARMEKYRHDWTRYLSAGRPIAVVRAETASQVQTALRWASAHRVPVVPRGAGTSLAGGATAVDGCVVVCTERMTALEIDPVNRVAVAGPGVLNVDLKQAAATHGLWYPPDPASFRISSIGGNVATNAGGLCCLKYGVTADYVLGLDVVLPDGRLITLGGRRIKDVAGLSLLQLFVGSEGTLGIITRVVLRLVPQQDPATTFVAYFSNAQDAGTAVVRICARLRPSLLELLDRVTINLIEDYRPMGLDRAAGAMLIGQSDAPGRARSADLAVMVECCRAAGAGTVVTAENPAEADLILEARRAAGPAVDARGPVLIEDVCVPVDRLPDVLDASRPSPRRGTWRSPSPPTLATATYTRPSSTPPTIRLRYTGHSRPWTKSCRLPSTTAVPSPANTASAAPNATRSPASSAPTSWI